MASRNLYLSNTPVDEAQLKYLQALRDKLNVTYEMVPVTQALDRVTRSAIYAKFSSPLFNASAMDGIAVISERTHGARETSPVDLKIEKDYIVVDTGDPINPPFDAVIMAEDMVEIDDETVRIHASASIWQHIRPVGEDIVAGEMILPGRHKIRPIDIGVLLSAGILQIEVVAKPHVAIYPTGTEIIEPTEHPREGSIIESNSRMFEAMVTQYGGVAHRFPAIVDEYDRIRDTIADAVRNYDMVVINAGSSAGREDFTVHVLRELGEVIVHGVAVKPGKPVILAIVENTPVIGLPGYPVSAYIAFENFVSPIISLLSQTDLHAANVIDAVIAKRMVSSLKHREYVRVKLGKVDDRLIAAPLARGAGAAMSMVRADGFCIIEQNREGVEAGEKVSVQVFREIREIENTLVLMGSHDMILDVIADIMPNEYQNYFVSSTHVGSMAGLMSLKRREAHLAPTHLLDEKTGAYNIPYLKRMFQEPLALIKGVNRIQGLIVKKGNPCNIQSIRDLTKYRYVNRQRGAGTRVLLDYQLKELGIDPSEIHGYETEAATHMAVAAMVESGHVDVGMGIFSAAKALDLDFVEISHEEYDFAIYQKDLELPQVKAFLEILRSELFRSELDRLGGYELQDAGKIILIGEE